VKRSWSRRAATILGVLAIVSCGGSSDATAPRPARGDLVFKLDAGTCTVTGGTTVNISFFVDGSGLGSADIAPGSGRSFNVTAGQHAIYAKLTNDSYTWPLTTVVVPENTSYTAVLYCP
jgi:hypothetical protein